LNNIITKQFENKDIIFDNQNYKIYLNATKTAKQFKKDVNEWKKLPSTIEYINVLKQTIEEDLFIVKRGGNDKNAQGTWIHEKLEDNFISWCKKDTANKTNPSLYLITDGELTKIGISNNLQSRLKSLQAGNGRELLVLFSVELENAFEIEQKLHKKFREKRLVGEWFSLTLSDIAIIKNEFETV
jgi:hypothetical protein